MANITIVLSDNTITVAGKIYSANGTLKALASGNNVSISSLTLGATLVSTNYANLVDEDDNPFESSAALAATKFNNYASGVNPEGFLKTAGAYGSIEFDLLNPDAEADGKLLYDPDLETLIFITANGNKIALGSVYYPIINKTGSTINAGTLVKWIGAEGDRLKVSAFDPSTDDELTLLGIVEKTISHEDEGIAVAIGYFKGIDTSTYTLQTILYASSTAGELTDVPPSLPAKTIPIAAVKTVSANGSIFVRPTAYHHLSDSHDVTITTPANNDLLAYNSTTGQWVNTNDPTVDNLIANTIICFGGVTSFGNLTASGTLTGGNTTINGTLGVSGVATLSTISCGTLEFSGSGISTISQGGTTTDLEISSNGNVTIQLDADDDETSQKFIVKNSSGDEVFTVDETGISLTDVNSTSGAGIFMNAGGGYSLIEFSGDGFGAGSTAFGLVGTASTSSLQIKAKALLILVDPTDPSNATNQWAMPNTEPSTGDIMMMGTSKQAIWFDRDPISYIFAGTRTISSTVSAVTSMTKMVDDNSRHNTTTGITTLPAGIYRICADVQFNQTAGAQRISVAAFLATGSNTNPINGTYREEYLRNTNTGHASVSINYLIYLNSTGTYRLMVQETFNQDSSTGVSAITQVSFNVEKIKEI